MRTFSFQCTDPELKKIENLMDMFGFAQLSDFVMESVRVMNMLAVQSERGYTIPVVLKPSTRQFHPLGPGLEYLTKVVERSEDNMIIKFAGRGPA